MQKNVEAVISRGDNLKNLEAKTENMSKTAAVFNSNTKKVKHKFYMKNKKWTIVIVVTILLLLLGLGVGLYFYFK